MTSTKLPICKPTVVLFTVSKSLDLSTVTYFVAIVSNSKPWTYALPGLRPTANLAFDSSAVNLASYLGFATVPTSVVSGGYIPRANCVTVESNLCSLTSMSKFLVT